MLATAARGSNTTGGAKIYPTLAGCNSPPGRLRPAKLTTSAPSPCRPPTPPSARSPGLPPRHRHNASEANAGFADSLARLHCEGRLPPSSEAPDSALYETDTAPYGFGDDVTSSPGEAPPPSLLSLRPDGSVAALRGLLGGRRVAILWDLDNVDFFAPACSAPLQVRRMRALVAEAGGRLVLCRAYGNLDTVRRLAAVLPLLEACGLLRVERVAVRRDAADVRLVNDAMEFAATHGSDGALMCVSQDTDFAAPLRFLSERGVRTVAVSPHDPRRRTHAAMEPATYFRRLPLPSSCWAALKWEPVALRVSAAEADWLRNTLEVAQQQQRRHQQQQTGGAADSGRDHCGAAGSAGAADGFAPQGHVGPRTSAMDGGNDESAAVEGAGGRVWEAGAGAPDVTKGAAAAAAAAEGAVAAAALAEAVAAAAEMEAETEAEMEAGAVEAASEAAAASRAGRREGEAVVTRAEDGCRGGGGDDDGDGGGSGSAAAAAAAATTEAKDVFVPPGLVPYTREDACCPGAATRLWLNPQFFRC